MEKIKHLFHPLAICGALFMCGLLLGGCSSNSDDNDTAELNNNNFIFVDATHGTATAAGTMEDPLDTIQEGIDLAATESKDVCVAEGTYQVDSDTANIIEMNSAVSLYGGYRNNEGSWTRDPASYQTIITDLAESGGTYDDPNRAINCGYGLQAGEPPVIDGFFIEGGGGDMSTGIFISEGSSVTINNCAIEIGDASSSYGIKNYSTDRDSGTLLTVTDSAISGGGGTTVTGIYLSRGDLTVTEVAVTGLIASSGTFGIDCGYGDIEITDSLIHGGTATGSTRALYLNEAFTSIVSDCTIDGGSGGSRSYGIAAMDTEGESSILRNQVDGGSGTQSVALELGWVEVNPSVDNNIFSVSGGTDRFGIWERDNISDPVSLKDNTFDYSLLAGSGTSVYYRDRTANLTTDITNIAQVNSLDEDGLNPTGTVSGNLTTLP